MPFSYFLDTSNKNKIIYAQSVFLAPQTITWVEGRCLPLSLKVTVMSRRRLCRLSRGVEKRLCFDFQVSGAFAVHPAGHRHRDAAGHDADGLLHSARTFISFSFTAFSNSIPQSFGFSHPNVLHFAILVGISVSGCFGISPGPEDSTAHWLPPCGAPSPPPHRASVVCCCAPNFIVSFKCIFSTVKIRCMPKA